MSVRPATWLIIGCVCACAPHRGQVASSYYFVGSPEREASLRRHVDGGSVISRDILVATEISDLQVSRDGKYYSYVRDGDMPSQLYVGRLGQAAKPLGGPRRVYWIGAHTLMFERTDGWYRADPSDDAFTRVTTKLIVREVENDYQHRQGLADIARDGSRVIFNIGDQRTKSVDRVSPWRYDVATDRLTRVIDNTRYRRIILDDYAQPAFAIDHGESAQDRGLKLFERASRGWLERTADLPSQTLDVVDSHGGTLLLRTGDGNAPRYVLWDPANAAVRVWLPAGATNAIVGDDRRTILAWRDKASWHAVDMRFKGLVATLDRLGIDQVSNESDVWTASATVGIHRASYTLNLTSGEIREISTSREQPNPTSAKAELATIPSLNGHPSEAVTVFQAEGAARGIVFWATTSFTSDRDREVLALLVTSRGYHLVTGTDSHVFEAAGAGHAAWAIDRFGQLPIACVNLRSCDFRTENLHAKLKALVRSPTGPNEAGWKEPDDTAEPVVPELLIGAGHTRATSFEEYDQEQAFLNRPEYVTKRERAPVAGIALRGSFSSGAQRELIEFAVIEGFLAQHLGGRMEPMPWDRLARGGLRVVYGLSKLSFLRGHSELAMNNLGPTQRSEIARGFESFRKAIFALPVGPPCDAVPDRILNLVPPPALREHRDSDEVQVMLNKLTRELGDVALAAGCTTGMITSAAEESIRRSAPASAR